MAREVLAGESIIVAQAGSTGGAIGNSGRSVSGGENQPVPRPARPERKTRGAVAGRSGDAGPKCSNIAGSWMGNTGIGMTASANGTVSSSVGFVGTWTCTGGSYVITWSPVGARDRLTLSSNGRTLSGISWTGAPAILTRQ